eukprot:gene14273-16408_t
MSSKAAEQVKVGVHPLVVASTCDHFTRVATGGSKLPYNAPVYGLLFGTKNETYTSICDSVDINYTYSGGDIHVLEGEIDNKVKLWTAVFTTYRLIGWYSFGAKPTADHRKIHTMIAGYTEDPIFLLINQESLEDSDLLPVSVYRGVNVGSNKSSADFADVSFRIETSDVEKVALDHITKSTPVPGLSALEVQNQSTLTSLRILDSKVGTIIGTLRAMKEGNLPMDHALLRSAAKICQSLPPIDSTTFREEFNEETATSLLLSYLSAATKTSVQLNDVSDIYNSIHSEKSYSM